MPRATNNKEIQRQFQRLDQIRKLLWEKYQRQIDEMDLQNWLSSESPEKGITLGLIMQESEGKMMVHSGSAAMLTKRITERLHHYIEVKTLATKAGWHAGELIYYLKSMPQAVKDIVLKDIRLLGLIQPKNLNVLIHKDDAATLVNRVKKN